MSLIMRNFAKIELRIFIIKTFDNMSQDDFHIVLFNEDDVRYYIIFINFRFWYKTGKIGKLD